MTVLSTNEWAGDSSYILHKHLLLLISVVTLNTSTRFFVYVELRT